MSRLELEDKKYELIKNHCLDPESDELSSKDKEILDRWIAASKILDNYPNRRHAAALLMTKFPDISRSTAYTDLNHASKLFNSLQSFDYDWWHQWLLNDISKHIVACREAGDRKNWAAGHANLLKAIGEKPDEFVDPKRHEKKDVYLAIQINNNTIKIDPDKLKNLQPGTYKNLIDALTKDIDTEEAKVIMDT
jgi:hypothetical protein